MKTSTCAMMLLAGLAATASADRIVRITGGPMQAGDGGEFRVTPISGGSVGLTGLATDSGNTYQTFCLERNQFIHLGQHYIATLDTFADNGGVAGGSPDPLSPETAYLYWSYRHGNLPGYELAESNDRKNDARSLQLAIWVLEDEITEQNGEYLNNTQAQQFVAFARSTTWDTIRNVRVLNLTGMNGESAQSQLAVVIPLPTTAGLAAMGLLAMGARRRR